MKRNNCLCDSLTRKKDDDICANTSPFAFLQSIKCCLCLVVKSAQDFAAKVKLGGQLKLLIYLFGRRCDRTNQSHFWGEVIACIGFNSEFHSVATVIALLILLLVAVVVSAHLNRGLKIIFEK